MNSIEDGEAALEEMDAELALDPQYRLSEPQTLMTAKADKAKFAEPLVKKLKNS